MAFELIRFSGSTLEPSSEPIMLYESHYYEKGAGRSLHIQLVPTRPTPPLNRKDKPPHIVIPTFNADDDALARNEDEYSAWSCNHHDREEEFLKHTENTNRSLEESTTAGATTTASTITTGQSENVWDTPIPVTSSVTTTLTVAGELFAQKP